MRKKVIIGLALLNGLFAFGAFATPALSATSNPIFFFFAPKDCCKGSGSFEYCCYDCCWTGSDNCDDCSNTL